MNSRQLRLAETSDHAAWDVQVESSPQGTVFSRSAFLQSLNAPFKTWVVESGQERVALVPVIEDAAGHAVRFPFTPYQGILFLPGRASEPRQRVLDEFRITEFVIAELAARYRRLEMAPSWNFQDIRPFLWHNYSGPGPQFSVQPRYTAVLGLDSFDAPDYPAQMRASRRQELKKAQAYTVREEARLDDFLRLYASTFARQSIALDEARLALVEGIASAAIRQGYGRLASCSTPEGIAAMSLFLYDSRRGYYLFAANDPAQRDSGASTRLMVDNILEAKRRGLRELDFVGVNSPARGDFKLSFNPELKLYFELTCMGNSPKPAAP